MSDTDRLTAMATRLTALAETLEALDGYILKRVRMGLAVSMMNTALRNEPAFPVPLEPEMRERVRKETVRDCMEFVTVVGHTVLYGKMLNAFVIGKKFDATWTTEKEDFNRVHETVASMTEEECREALRNA